MDATDHRRRLITILRNAYSGEQAAALAYRGHWHSIGEHPEADEIRRIEEEEWYHRREVGKMLAELGSSPAPHKEIRTWIVGRILYANGYMKDAAQRGPGFLVQALATLFLLLGGLGRVIYLLVVLRG